jgi:hypothetical protein
MTPRELIEILGRHPLWMAGLGLTPPALALLCGLVHAPGRGRAVPWKYLYTVLVYAACVPGIGAAVLTAYTLFFTHESLLDKDLLVYGLPIVSMVVTLIAIRKRVTFDEVPGFDRLSGLLALIAVTFIIVLAIQKIFIGIFFGASILILVAVGVFLFALLKWGASALFRRGGEPRPKPPTFP